MTYMVVRSALLSYSTTFLGRSAPPPPASQDTPSAIAASINDARAGSRSINGRLRAALGRHAADHRAGSFSGNSGPDDWGIAEILGKSILAAWPHNSSCDKGPT